jgi:magnesium-transporting ATPase (P-type)
VAARDVVPGDLLLLREGDAAAADAETLAGNALAVADGADACAPRQAGGGAASRLPAGAAVTGGCGEAEVANADAAVPRARPAMRLSSLQRLAVRATAWLTLLTLLASGAAAVVSLRASDGRGARQTVLIALALAFASAPDLLLLPRVACLAAARELARARCALRDLDAAARIGGVTAALIDREALLARRRSSSR